MNRDGYNLFVGWGSAMKRLRWALLLAVSLLFPSHALAAIAISGFVADDEGHPIAGATVELRRAPTPLSSARHDLEGEPTPLASATSAVELR